MHKLHLFVTLLYPDDLRIILKSILYCNPLLFSSHTYFESSVSAWRASFVNDILWLANLSLKFSLQPIYTFFSYGVPTGGGVWLAWVSGLGSWGSSFVRLLVRRVCRVV